MKVRENLCVDCGLPCLRDACPHRNVTIVYCDECGDYAQYEMDDQDLCKDCAEKYVDGAWDDLTLTDKIEALKIEHKTYG